MEAHVLELFKANGLKPLAIIRDNPAGAIDLLIASNGRTPDEYRALLAPQFPGLMVVSFYGAGVVTLWVSIRPVLDTYAGILAQIAARPTVAIGSLKKGALCKVGSNALRILSKRKGEVQVLQILASGATGWTLSIKPDVPATPLTQLDIDQTQTAIVAEGIKPASILDGLSAALNTYLAAVKRLDNE